MVKHNQQSHQITSIKLSKILRCMAYRLSLPHVPLLAFVLTLHTLQYSILTRKHTNYYSQRITSTSCTVTTVCSSKSGSLSSSMPSVVSLLHAKKLSLLVFVYIHGFIVCAQTRKPHDFKFKNCSILSRTCDFFSFAIFSFDDYGIPA